jgi:hypothetical protein
MRSTAIVEAFWDDVWNARDPGAVDRFVADDVVIEAGGQSSSTTSTTCTSTPSRHSRTRTAPASRPDGLLTGTNNGILGTEANGKPIAMTGTAVWTVDDGKLRRGWVEQASFELYHWLLAK